MAGHVRGCSPSRALRPARARRGCDRGGGGGGSDYADLLITRFSLALGRHAKIAFTARGGPTLNPARPRIARVGGTTSFSPVRPFWTFVFVRREVSASCPVSPPFLALAHHDLSSRASIAAAIAAAVVVRESKEPRGASVAPPSRPRVRQENGIRS